MQWGTCDYGSRRVNFRTATGPLATGLAIFKASANSDLAENVGVIEALYKYHSEERSVKVSRD